MWMRMESFKTIVLCFRNVLDHRACRVWCYDEGHKAKCVHHWFRIYLLCYRKCSHLRRRCAVYSRPATVTTFWHIIRATMRCLKMTGSTVFDGYFFFTLKLFFVYFLTIHCLQPYEKCLFIWKRYQYKMLNKIKWSRNSKRMAWSALL